MARDIHDTVAQGFTGVLLLPGALEPELADGQETARAYPARARDTARDNPGEARSMIEAASPPASPSTWTCPRDWDCASTAAEWSTIIRSCARRTARPP